MQRRISFDKKNSEKPVVVISAVNLIEGGPLSIFQDAVSCFTKKFISNYRLIVLLHDKKIFHGFYESSEVKLIEYAYPKRSWFLRIWFEYVHCYFISKKIKPYLWFSLHDLTPNVAAENKIVYCHNPVPFYKLAWPKVMMEKSLIFFNLFYSFFYRLNIRSNKYVVVQQQWIRNEFEKRYRIKNIIVSYPDVQISPGEINGQLYERKKCVFLYPSLPRVYKNFEVLLNATEMLQKTNGDFEVIFTFDGSENRYASKLVNRYKDLSSAKFVGLQTREQLLKLYSDASCLVFASTTETWGLPITEMKAFNKPIIIANYKYARETVGNYDKACFFDAKNVSHLVRIMKKAIAGTLEFDKTEYFPPSQPFAQSWEELFCLILS